MTTRADTVVTNVTTAVAAAGGVGPEDLNSLYSDIDPEVLERLFERNDTGWEGKFQ